MLELNKVTKYFQNKKVLNEISFSITKGKIAVLLGPSGCGKTTLLKIIAGLENIQKGTITLNKNIVSEENYYIPPNKRNINMVFQDLALWPHMNVKKHILFALSSNVEYKKGGRIKKLKQLLKQFELEKHEKKFPNKLSGGEQQRLAIARALATEPDILLLDEPLANLDLLIKTKIQKLLIELNKKYNITILYVTHDQIEALMLAEEIILINDRGEIEQIDTSYNLLTKPKTEFVANFMKFDYEYIKEMKKKLLS